MIEKELVTTQTEVWRDPHHTHRYVFKRQWAIKGKEAEDKLAVVITIRPTDTETGFFSTRRRLSGFDCPIDATVSRKAKR